MEHQTMDCGNPFRLTPEELDTLWARINGHLTDQGDVPNEFTDGAPCDILYGAVCDARERLSQRTGIDFEDRDVLAIVEALEEIGRRCAFRMVEYLSEKLLAGC